MKLLIVAATSIEINPLLLAFKFDGGSLKIGEHEADILITGVGMVPTAFAMGQKMAQKQYDLALNLGIAGSFDQDLPIGEVVSVSQDVFADWGAEDDQDFLSIDDLGFGDSVQHESYPKYLKKNVGLRQVKGITVNKAHGEEMTIAKTKTRLKPQVESMEGAAFFYACRQVPINCIQIRAISNYVERRNRDNWNIGLAVKNLNRWAIDFLTTSL